MARNASSGSASSDAVTKSGDALQPGATGSSYSTLVMLAAWHQLDDSCAFSSASSTTLKYEMRREGGIMPQDVKSKHQPGIDS